MHIMARAYNDDYRAQSQELQNLCFKPWSSTLHFEAIAMLCCRLHTALLTIAVRTNFWIFQETPEETPA
jgi:hypothetical protein